MKSAKTKKPLIGIIGGKGKMGNWFKIFFEKNGLKVIVSDKNTKLSNKELTKQADIIIISVPIQKTIEVVKEIKDSVRKDALLTDLTSIKFNPLKEMKKAKSGVLGMHPLFGPMVLNLKNQTIVFCREKDNCWTEFLKNLFIQNGAKIIEMDPKTHDLQMAFTQALLHFINLAYTQTLKRKKFKPNFYLLTPVFKLQSLVIGRILSQNQKLYADLEIENPYFLKILDQFLKETKNLAKIIKTKNYFAFENLFLKLKPFFGSFIDIAKNKTSEILKFIEKQPIKFGQVKKIKMEKANIGFLGPKGTFSYEAAKKCFSKNKLIACSSIGEIFQLITEEKISLAVVPIENSNAGLVSETIYGFVNFPVTTLGSFILPIHHCLISKEKNLSKIKIIKSHPQAISQCQRWLEKNLYWAKKENTASTLSGLEEKIKKEAAFIIPCSAVSQFRKKGFSLLAKNIENQNNFTRFLVISSSFQKQIAKKLKASKTLLLISVYDRPGILRDILSVFADKKINLSALHSIPSYSAAWDYFFFLEIEKPINSKEIEKSLKELEEFCPYIRLIGAS